MNRLFWTALLSVVWLGSLWAQQQDALERARLYRPERLPTREWVVTDHQIQLADGRTLRYTATTGYLSLFDEDGTHKANVFFVYYKKAGVDDPRTRPITFAFNGGPGSSSVWLHLGALGPRRVLMDEEGFALPPPYQLVDNPHTWLDWTDLVFIDPVTTGYSRAAIGEDPKQFHGYEEDIESVGAFIRLWTTEFERWASPKFLAGESYGTTRASGLAGYLQQRHGMYLNGIVLISAITNFQTARFNRGNDLPYVLFLPTYTATAWYHKQLPPDLQARPLEEVLEEVRAFAKGAYATALMAGDELPPEEADRIARQLARYTGLSEDYVKATNLRIQIFRFTKELLRDQRLTVGRLDSRFTGMDYDAAGERFEYDPSYAAIQGPYTALLNDYLRRELHYKNSLPYEILTGRVRPWNYDNVQNQYLNVSETLRQAMTQNPALKVHIANGYYDLATPFFATEYTVSHMGLEPALRQNISMSYYESGHMMYIKESCLEDLARHVRAFYEESLKR